MEAALHEGLAAVQLTFEAVLMVEREKHEDAAEGQEGADLG